MAENQKPVQEPFAIRWLGRLSDAIYRYPRVFFYPQLLLFVLCVIFTIGRFGPFQGIQFDLNRDNLVGSEKKYHQNFQKFKKEFPSQDDLVVVVESDSPAKNRQFVNRIGARLETETNLFVNVFYQKDLKMLGRKALLFVPEDDLKDLKKTLHAFRPFINQFTEATNLVSLFAMINGKFRTAKQEENAENESLVNAIPALERIVSEGTRSMQLPGTPTAPGLNALFGAGDEDLYITFATNKIYLVTTQARTDEQNEEAVHRLRELIHETQGEITGVNVGLTGEPVLEIDEMAQSQRDSTKASIVSLLLCAAIFIYAYRETGRPLKAVFCLIIGLGYTMGFTTLVIGHLNILTITFVPMLVGLAIDFGVHLISRYEEETRRGQPAQAALRKAVAYTGLGIFTGALTTSGAFLAMGLTQFKGIQEMGIICGAGMLLCFIPMITMLPVLLLRGRQNVLDRRLEEIVGHREKIQNLWLRRPRLVTIFTVAVCALAVTQLPKVYFDYNLLNMQSAGLPAVVYETKLIKSADKSVLFAAVIATNLSEAKEIEAKLKNPKLSSVIGGVESMTQFLTEDQTRKLQVVRDIKADISGIHFRDVDLEPVNVSELSRTMWSLQGYLGLAMDATEKDDPDVAKKLGGLRNAITDFRRVMINGNPDVQERLGKFQQALFSDIRETFEALRDQDSSSPITINDLPKPLRDRFVGINGKYLVQVYPKEDVWQRKYQEEFVQTVRKVLDPKDTGEPIITGTPVQLLEYTTLLKDSYVQAAWYALAAIALMVLIHFRSLLCVILALLPVGIGTLWMVGIMGAANIPFNPANIMTLPLVIGIGVTNGIHILNRFAEERTAGIFSKSTGKAVLVSGFNTIAGFGSLMLARHRGIYSLGFVMSVGVFTCMFAALTFLPVLLKLLIRRGWAINKEPSGDMHKPTLGPEEPR